MITTEGRVSELSGRRANNDEGDKYTLNRRFTGVCQGLSAATAAPGVRRAQLKKQRLLTGFH